MKDTLCICLICLVACATDPHSGKATFFRRTGGEWAAIGLNIIRRALPIVKEELHPIILGERTPAK